MSKALQVLRNQKFENFFDNWCIDGTGGELYTNPEAQRDQMREAFDEGAYDPQELFIAVRDLPETDRMNFFRMQLQQKPIPVDIVVPEGSKVKVKGPVTETMLDFARIGYLYIHNDPNNPFYENVKIEHISPIMDTTKGFCAIAFCHDKTSEFHENPVASFTYGKLVEYVAVGMMVFTVAESFDTVDPRTSFGPEELLMNLVNMVK